MLHKEITEVILKIYFEVYNELGYGFLEKVYQNSMYLALKKQGFLVEAQKKIEVFYQGNLVGEYYADLVVEGTVLLELKATEYLIYQNEQQLINYLRATKMEVGLLLNFGKSAEFKRIIFTNDRKKHTSNKKM